jgi:NhaA family Na+:H+ antiporter
VAVDLERILARLEPFVVRFVLPAFAVVVASVPLDAGDVQVGVVLGIVCGLAIGKPLGVIGAWSLLARCGVADLPRGSTARELLGVSILAGIGFTVSLFIARAGLSSEPLRNSATIGVLLGSLLATGMAAWYFRSPE